MALPPPLPVSPPDLRRVGARVGERSPGADAPRRMTDPTRPFRRKPPRSADERARRAAWGQKWGAILSRAARQLQEGRP